MQVQELTNTLNVSGDKALTKSELIRQWSNLQPNQDPLSVMQPIKGGGSSYGGDGIRISGSCAFVSAVLSRLTDMIDAENDLMLLKASHSIVKPTEINGEVKDWKYSGGHVVYIQLGMRSGPGICQRERTERYIDRVPGLRDSLRRGRIAWLMFLGFTRREAEERTK